MPIIPPQKPCALLNRRGLVRSGTIARYMLTVIGALLLLSLVIFIYTVQAPRSNDANMGRMSTQWIAEHRASKEP